MTNLDLFHAFSIAGPNENEATNNLFFRNDICYSYGYHFPMAVKVRDAIGNVTHILWNAESRSKTTSKQQSELRGALGHFDLIEMYTLGIDTPETVFNLKNKGWQDLMIAELVKGVKLAEESAKAYPRARTTKEYHVNNIISHMWRISNIAETFKLKSKLPNKAKKWSKVCDTDMGAAQALFGIDFIEFNEILEANKAKAELKREREAAAAKVLQAERLYKFRAFELRSFGSVTGYTYLRFDSAKKEVQTSQGVVISTVEAKRLLRLIDTGKVVGESVDNKYRVVASNGVFKAGCHTIEWTEIEAIREQILNT